MESNLLEDIKNRAEVTNEAVNETCPHDISIMEVAIAEEMSQRSLNVCINAEIFTLSDLLNYRLSNTDFLSLRNCGFKSNHELLNICNKYNELILKGELNLRLDIKLIEGISSVKLTENYNLDMLSQIEHMSRRSYNVCRNAGLTSLKLILNYYINSPEKQFFPLRECGVVANAELVNICEKYKSCIIEIKNVEKASLDDEFSPFEFITSSLKLDFDSYSKLKAVLSSKNQIRIFEVINCLIDSDSIFRKRSHTFIFKQLFHSYVPYTEHTLEEVGQMMNLTRERVRQIAEKTLLLLKSRFEFLKNIHKKTASVNYIDVSEPVIYISDEIAHSINADENTNFSPFFISYILSIVYFEDYQWLGNISNFLSKNKSSRKEFFNHSYLVHREILKRFEIEKFIRHLSELVDQKRTEDTEVPFLKLFKGFTNGFPMDPKDLAALKFIINAEFEDKIECTTDGLIFLKNKAKTLVIKIAEVLQLSKKPLHFGEVYNKLAQQGITQTMETIHQVLNHETEIFGLKGRGLFGLRNKGGYFGTIGDIAEKILVERGAPVLLKEIEDIICKELTVSRRSIKNNLFHYAPEVRFIRLRNGYIGLKERDNCKFSITINTSKG